MHSFIKFGRIILTIALITGLAACGGSGSGTVATTATTIITGSAGDGPVTLGTVTVTDGNNNAVTTVPASPSTGTNAQFSFTVPSNTPLPLTITVTGGHDEVTGKTQNFDLQTAVTTLPTNGSVTGNANPLSTLAVASARAQGGGTLTTTILTTAANNVLGAMGFGLAAGTTDPLFISTPVTNNNIANIVRANEAAAELIRRAALASGNTLANTITSIAEDLTDGIVDGNVAAGANNTQVNNANAAHILNQQARVSAETLANNLTVTTPAGTAIPAASGVKFITSLNNSITTTGHTGDVTNEVPTQAFLDQTRNTINIANTLAGGNNVPLNNLLGSINSLTAGSTPTTAQMGNISTLTTTANASFTTATTGANTLATATNATNQSTTTAADTTAPAAPTITIPNANVTTQTTTLTVTGTSENNALVTVLSSSTSGSTSLGTVSANGAGGWTLNATGLIDGAHAITATATDTAGNTSPATAVVATITVDTIQPTVAIASNVTALKAGTTATLTFTLSETSTDFVAADVTVAGGTLSAFAGAGTVYTATFTPATNSTTGATVDVAAGTFTDAATNTNTVATQLTITVDTTAPTLSGVSIASNNATASTVAKTGDTVTVTFISSETLGALPTATIATKAAVVANTGGNTYTAIYTMVAGDPQGVTAFTIDFADAIGNAGTQVTAVTDATAVAFDSAAPTLSGVSIASNNATASTVAKTGDTVTVTFTSSETLGALPTATIATKAAVVANTGGNTYTATYTMVAGDTQGATAFTIDFTDAIGNAGQVAAVTDATAVAFDSAAPTATLSTLATSPTNASPISVKVVFSEPVTGVALVNFTVGNGVASNLVAVSTTIYTVDVTPAGAGAVTVDVAANAASDAAGNGNTVATQLSVTYDNVASAPVIATPTTGSFTTSTTPTVRGLAGSVEANATVNVFDTDGTTSLGTTSAAGDGSWTLTSSALATGTHTITAKQTDAATNTSAASTATTITINNIPRFAYVANRGNNTVSMYTVDSTTGQLKHNGYIAAGTTPSAVATSPSGKFLYVANNGSNNVTAYTINQTTGQLSTVGTVLAGTTPDFVAIDPFERFVYVGNQNSSNVSAYTINQTTGALTTAGTVTAGTQPRRVTVDPSGRFAYVANLASNNISAYTIDQTTGALTSIGTAISSGGTSPMSVKVDPTGRFAYVTNNFTSTVFAFTINQSSGALATIGGLSTGTNPGELAIDPSGTFVYVANGTSNDVSTYSIDQTTGALTSLGVIASAGTNTANISVDPSGKFVYAVDDGTKSLSVFSINPADGTLTLDSSITTQSTPRMVAITGGTTPVTYAPKFAYVANANTNNVSAYSVNQATGALSAIAGSPFAAGIHPRSIAVAPSGKFAYAANLTDGTISAYTVNQTTGELISVGAAITTGVGSKPAMLTVDPTGRFVYTANNGTDKVSAFTINTSTGVLTAVAGSPFAAGSLPFSVTTDPSGRFVYVTNNGGTFGVSAYTVNLASGALTSIAGSPFATGAGPRSISIDPSGKFAYVANFSANTVSAYTINQATGALAAIAGSPFPTGIWPQSVTIDTSGKFVYVANFTDNTVSAFTINQTTGALTAMAGSPFATGGTDPTSVTVDPSGAYAYVSNQTSGDVSAFTINQTTGVLTAITGAPFTAGAGTWSVAVSNTFDTVAPAQPAITSPTGGATVTTNTPTISGTAEAGSTITLSSGVATLTVVGTTTADAAGNWTLTSSALVNGTHTLTVTATDASGNVSVVSAGVTITVAGNALIAGAVVDGKVANATLTLFSDQAMTTQVGSGSTDGTGAFSVILTVATAPDPLYIKSVGGIDLDTGLAAPTMMFVGNTAGGSALTSFNITPITNSLFTTVVNDTSGAAAGTKLTNAITSQSGTLGLPGSALFLDPSLTGSPLTTLQGAATSSPLVQALTSGTVAGTISGSAAGTTYKLFALATGEGDIGVDIGAPGSTTIADVKGLIVTADISVYANGTVRGTNIIGTPGTSITGKVQGSSIVLDITNGTGTTFITRVVGQIGLNGSISGNFTDIQSITTTPVMSKGIFVGAVIPSTGLNPAGIATFVSNFYSPGAATGTMNIVAKDSFVSAGQVPQVRWGQADVLTVNASTGATTMSNMTLREDAGSVASTTNFGAVLNGSVTFTFNSGEYVIDAATTIPSNILIFEYNVPGTTGKLYVITAVGLRRGVYMVIDGTTNQVINIGESYMSKASSNLAPGLKNGVTYDLGIAFVHPGMVGGTRANATGSANPAITQPLSVGPIKLLAASTGFSASSGFMDSSNTGGLLQELFVFQGSTMVMKKDANNTFLDNPFGAILNGTFHPVDIPFLATATPEDHLRVVQFSESGAIEGEGAFGGSFDHDNNPLTPAIDMKGSPATFVGFFHDQTAGTPTFTGTLNFLARTMFANSFAGFSNAYLNGSIQITAPTATVAGSGQLTAALADGTPVNITLVIDPSGTGAAAGFGIYHMHGADTTLLNIFIDVYWPIGGTKATYIQSDNVAGTGNVTEIGEAFITQ